MSKKNSNDTVGNRTCPQPFVYNNEIIRSFRMCKIVNFIVVRVKHIAICYVTLAHDYTKSLYFC
jgi:hypothetical protein